MDIYFPELKKIMAGQAVNKKLALENESTVNKYHDNFHADIDNKMQDASRKEDIEEYLGQDNSDFHSDTENDIGYILDILKLLPDYKKYNAATIRHNIDIVLQKAANKNIDLSRDQLLALTCEELKKKHSNKRARRKKDSVPSVTQIQNHLT